MIDESPVFRAAVAMTALGVAVGSTITAGVINATRDSCERVDRPVVVDLHNIKHDPVIDHAFDAIALGKPRILHIARDEAKTNRRLSLRGIPTKEGYDRDEYPPAMSDEGGKGAHIRYVVSSINRSAGSLMGRQLRAYCNGQAFVIEP